MRYLLPGHTAQLVQRHAERCRNLGLILDKFVPEEAIGKSEGKSRWLKELAPTPPPDRLEMQVDLRLWEALYQRWLALTKAAGAEPFQATLAWRMVVGLGGQSVLESDLTLDHLSGLPIIPGSALKGLTRAYAAMEKSDPPRHMLENDTLEVKRIFGMQETGNQQAGTVIFFDALPVPIASGGKNLRFVVDIMNPHYPNYYRENGKHAPSNDQSPVPVTFLTVEGAMFAFAIAPRATGMDGDAGTARNWLKEALQKYGVGGKTSAGYGAFKAQEEQPLSASTHQQAASFSAHPQMTREEAEARIQGRTKITEGMVQERTEEEAIVKFKDPKIGLLGFIPKENFGGRALAKGNSIPSCEIKGVVQRNGEWYVLLKCPPK